MQSRYLQSISENPARYQSFFTEAKEINDLMISLLGDVSDWSILEPSVGTGALIKPLIGKAKFIDAVDIDHEHIVQLRRTVTDSVRVQEGDFVDYFVSGASSSGITIEESYDAVICNPPYGLKFSVSYRKQIKRAFPSVYARESYGLFVDFSIRRLREGGRFVFILPDTFLTSRNHRPLRSFLSENANISHLIQFNSARFESVNFGYGDICIIAGNRSSSGQNGDVRWLDYRRTEDRLEMQAFEGSSVVKAHQLRRMARDGWTIYHEDSLIFGAPTERLGELAECRTGIYTGDNRRFCGFDQTNPPSRLNGHAIQWDRVRNSESLTDVERSHGLTGERSYVLFVRGGHRAPFERTKSALNWSRESVEFYRTDKKARLQNAGYYFKEGIAVPMVTSGRLTASYMEGAVFDQGVVGIFPYNDDFLCFLLVFLNSEHATTMKRRINPGANNSANYLKRLHVPVPDDRQLQEANSICQEWRKSSGLDKVTVLKQATDFIERNFSPTKVAS